MLTHLLLLAQITLPAFLGAQGGGATSVGGRGGQIIEVTNANDSGAGSLRACVMASGPRICIFRLGAQIVNLSRLQVSNPFLTIAGQTAPGGGITIGGANMKNEALFIDTHDVVVQNVTCNGYNPNTPTGPDTGTVCFELTSGAHDVIFDHISARWWGNKGWISYSNDTSGPCCAKVIKNITLQRAIIAEPNRTHPVGPGTDSISWPKEGTQQDFHHILFANIDHRIPMVATDGVRLASSIIFNWGYFAFGQGGSSSDITNNLWAPGNLNVGNSNPHPVQAWLGQPGNCQANCDLEGTPSIYMSGNIGPQGTDYALTAEEAGTDAEGTPEVATPIRQAWRRSTPLPAETFPIAADPPNVLAAMAPSWGNSQGLDCSGNWIGHQDSQDARIIHQYQTQGPGNTFVGQFTQPAIDPGTPCPLDPANHLPLAYEARMGIPAGTPANTKAANGDTIFNNYLGGVASVPPPPVSPNGATITPSTGGSLTDSSANVWTFGANVPVGTNPDCTPLSCGNLIVKNGTPLAGTAATLLLWYNGFIYQENAKGLWWEYTANGTFTKVSGDPRPPVNPVVTSVTTTCPTPIQPTATSQCSVVVQGTGTFNPAVTWTATGGTVSASGLYTPASGAASGVITATSVQTPSVSGKATVIVSQAPPPVCPALPVKVAVTVGGVAVGSMTCTPAADGKSYTCSIP